LTARYGKQRKQRRKGKKVQKAHRRTPAERKGIQAKARKLPRKERTTWVDLVRDQRDPTMANKSIVPRGGGGGNRATSTGKQKSVLV